MSASKLTSGSTACRTIPKGADFGGVETIADMQEQPQLTDDLMDESLFPGQGISLPALNPIQSMVKYPVMANFLPVHKGGYRTQLSRPRR